MSIRYDTGRRYNFFLLPYFYLFLFVNFPRFFVAFVEFLGGAWLGLDFSDMTFLCLVWSFDFVLGGGYDIRSTCSSYLGRLG